MVYNEQKFENHSIEQEKTGNTARVSRLRQTGE